MKTKLWFFLYIILFTTACYPQDITFNNWDEVQTEINRIEGSKDYNAAIEFINSVKDNFPENEFEVILESAYCYGKIGNLEAGLDKYEYGQQLGFFFGLNFRSSVYAPYKESERFAKLIEKDRELRNAALEKSKTIYEVKLPENYNESNLYPAIVILHGGGRTLKDSQKHWISERTDKEFVKIFIQSYLHYTSKTFGWAGFDPRARKEMRECFDEVVGKYSIDTTKVIIGGISAGGSASIDFSINNIIPTNGFIGICPGKPREFDSERVKAANEKNVSGYILSGETDFYLERAKEMVAIFDETNFNYYFEIIEGMGHEYPKDFSERIEQALNFLIK